MSDLIRIIDLLVYAHVGVPEDERRSAQKLLISLEMAVESFAKAAAADDVSLTVNYYSVAQRVKVLAGRRRSYKLVETLAEKIASTLLEEFPIKSVKVEIKKFVLPDARWVAIQIMRSAKPRD